MQYKKKIIEVGGSQGILIPIDLCSFIGIKIGDEMIIQDDCGKHGKFISMWKAE